MKKVNNWINEFSLWSYNAPQSITYGKITQFFSLNVAEERTDGLIYLNYRVASLLKTLSDIVKSGWYIYFGKKKLIFLGQRNITLKKSYETLIDWII